MGALPDAGAISLDLEQNPNFFMESSLSDEALMLAAAGGDLAAFEQLVLRHQSRPGGRHTGSWAVSAKPKTSERF